MLVEKKKSARQIITNQILHILWEAAVEPDTVQYINATVVLVPGTNSRKLLIVNSFNLAFIVWETRRYFSAVSIYSHTWTFTCAILPKFENPISGDTEN